MKATTARVLDKRRARKKTKKINNEEVFPLVIRVKFNRVPNCFPIGIDISEKDFSKLSAPRIGDRLSEIRDKFLEEEERAKKIIESLGTFTFQAFREKFYKDAPSGSKNVALRPIM